MSIKIMSRVWEHSKQKGSKLLLLLAIADNANDGGHAYPGMPYLARKIRMSKRQTRRLVRQLATTDELAVIWGGAHKGDYHNYYVLIGLSEGERDAIKADVAQENASKGDNLSSLKNDAKGDIFDAKGDIAMSREPLTNIDINQVSDINLSLWGDVKRQLQMQMARQVYETWIIDTKVISVDGDTWTVAVKSQAAVDWLTHRLYMQIADALGGLVGRAVTVAFQVAMSEGTGNE